MGKRAYSLIRQAPHYRREAFASGLKAVGYEVIHDAPTHGAPGDLLLTWNRYGYQHEVATRFERGGGRVLVAENGYLGVGGTIPKFDVHPGGPKPEHYYSLAWGWNNGRGQWPNGGPERFAALGVKLKDWRRAGEHVLVCPNRSFGVGEQIMPVDWADTAAAQIRKLTARPVVVRRHPGNSAPKRPLAADLQNAWVVFIWSSGAGIHALIEGIPVFCMAPFWILKSAASAGYVEKPLHPEREPAFERMAWSQWSLREIESGEPFHNLLRTGLEEKVG